MFRIVVEELVPTNVGANTHEPIERFRQSVDTLDLKKLIEAVNYKPRVRKAAAKQAAVAS